MDLIWHRLAPHWPSWRHFRAIVGHLGAIFGPLWAILAAELLSQSFGSKRVNLFGALGGLKIELSPRRGAFFVFVCIVGSKAY